MRIFLAAVSALSALIVLGAASAEAEPRGEEIFEQACASCHLQHMSAAETDHAEDLLAPPMNLLSTIIRKKTGNDKAAFIAHVVDFTREPAVEKVRAMAEAVKRFGLMPPIQDIDETVGEADLQAVASWLYDRYDYEKELAELLEHEQSVGE